MYCISNPMDLSNEIIRYIQDDVIKWEHFPPYWLFVWGIHRSPVNSPHKGQWRGTLMFFLSAPWINSSVNNREAGDLRRHRAHYDVIVMICQFLKLSYLPQFTRILQWRHNKRDGVSNHQPTIVYSTVYSGADQWKHQSSALLAFVTGEFPAQRASNAENVSIWWRHHGFIAYHCPNFDAGLANLC